MIRFPVLTRRVSSSDAILDTVHRTGLSIRRIAGFVSSTSTVSPSSWIGAYNWDDGVGANLVTSASGSTTLGGPANVKINSPNNLAPLVSGGFDGAGYSVDSTGNSSSSFMRGFDMGYVYNPPALSFGYWGRRLVSGSPGPDTHTSMDFNTLTGIFSPNANSIYNDAATGFLFPQTVEVADTAWHHYAFTWSSSDNVWRAYVDGALVSQVTSTGTFRFKTFGVNNSISGARSGYRDNLFVIASRISDGDITMLASGFMPNSSGIMAYQPETASWLTRITQGGGAVTSTDLYAIDAFVTSIKALGLTDANSRINPFAGTSLTSALYPIFRGGGPDADSAVNFVSGDYTRISGITGDGSSKYLNTGLNASSVIAPGSSGAPSHGFVYNRTSAASANAELGADDASGSGRFQMHIKYTNGNSYYDAYSFVGGGRTAVSNPGNSLRLAGGIRSSASSSNILVDGAVVGATSTTSSGTAPATPVYVFALNTAGTPGFYSPRSLGGYSFGGVVPTNNATYATAWQTLMTAFGRQV